MATFGDLIHGYTLSQPASPRNSLFPIQQDFVCFLAGFWYVSSSSSGLARGWGSQRLWLDFIDTHSNNLSNQGSKN